MKTSHPTESGNFLVALTLVLIGASLWIFSAYLHYLLVAAVLALSTSHLFVGLVNALNKAALPRGIKKSRRALAAALLTLFFLMMIFMPLLYFVAVTYNQVAGLDLAQIKQTVLDMTDQAFAFLEGIPLLQAPLERLQSEGISLLKGSAFETLVEGAKGLMSGIGGLFGQIAWILLFYFLFNLYGHQILGFAAGVMPMTLEHKKYLYQECTGTVAVVFYGTLYLTMAI